jgi:hypothetical protein
LRHHGPLAGADGTIDVDGASLVDAGADEVVGAALDDEDGAALELTELPSVGPGAGAPGSDEDPLTDEVTDEDDALAIIGCSTSRICCSKVAIWALISAKVRPSR